MLTLADIRDRATLSITETAELLEMGINQAYAAAREGTIPTLRLGRSYRVPVPALLALLGETCTPEISEAEPASSATAQIHALTTSPGDPHHAPNPAA